MRVLSSVVRRLTLWRHPRRVALARVTAIGAAGALAAAAACSEALDGGAGCTGRDRGDLCPVANARIIDTTLDPVVLDTALAGVPTTGDLPALLLALRPGPDSLDVRAVVRFDSIPSRFSPPAGGDSAAITTVQATGVRLTLDTSGTRLTGPLTVEAYDVDTTAGDTLTAALAPLFRSDRLVGSAALAAQAVPGDTLRVPLSDAFVAARAQRGGRVRLGFRLVGAGSARVRIVGVGAGGVSSASPVLSFDPATDTTFRPIQVFPSSTTPPLRQLAPAYRTQTLVVRTPRLPDGTDLVVGGLPARRSYLRFSIPSRFVDSVDVVRAQLLLTQRPSGAVDPLDSVVVVRQLAGLATDSVADLLRASGLTSGAVAGDTLPTVRLSPAGSGPRAFPVVLLLRAWRNFPAGTPRVLVLRSALEGAQAAEVRFYSVQAPAGLRPQLRLSYVPRTTFGLP